MIRVWKSLFFVGVGILLLLPNQAAASDLVFPQLADGGGIRSEILLTNPADKPDTGAIRFRDVNGNPLQIRIGGALLATVPYNLPAGGTLRLLTDGVGGTKSGYAILSSDLADSVVTGTIVYNLSGFEVSVPSAPVADRYHVFSERSQSSDSGVALANPDTKECMITLVLLNEDGSQRDTATITLAPGQQTARFISQIFEKADIGFRGSVQAYGTIPFSMVGLRLRDSGSLATLSGSPRAVPR